MNKNVKKNLWYAALFPLTKEPYIVKSSFLGIFIMYAQINAFLGTIDFKNGSLGLYEFTFTKKNSVRKIQKFRKLKKCTHEC